MNPAVAMDDVGVTLGNERLEGVLSFLASRSRSSARVAPPSATDVFNGCATLIDQVLRSAIETRTAREFDKLFETAFPKYVGLTLAMSHFATSVIPRPALDQLTRDAICEMEADFRDRAAAVFGTEVRDQALFTVWTLRKISDLLSQITSVKLDDSKKKDDAHFSSHFNLDAFRAQFSLDCLNKALDGGQPVYPEVLEELVDGLRAMVNAYAWARRGLEARVPVEEQSLTPLELDDADRDLMEFSMSQAADLLEGEGA